MCQFFGLAKLLPAVHTWVQRNFRAPCSIVQNEEWEQMENWSIVWTALHQLAFDHVK